LIALILISFFDPSTPEPRSRSVTAEHFGGSSADPRQDGILIASTNPGIFRIRTATVHREIARSAERQHLAHSRPRAACGLPPCVECRPAVSRFGFARLGIIGRSQDGLLHLHDTLDVSALGHKRTFALQ
jgi:hypothetical protein